MELRFRSAWWFIVAVAVLVTFGLLATAWLVVLPFGEEMPAEVLVRWRRTSSLAALGAGAAVLIVGATIVHRYERHLQAMRREETELARRQAESALQSRAAVILGLAKLAESRDDETGQHLDRIRHYVRLLGEALIDTHPEVDAEFVEMIVETSALHDIGKVGIPDHVLLNPGMLSDEQREIVKKHTTIGGDILFAVRRRWGDDPFLTTACEIVFAHHERYDGTGYPFGLSGETIPLAGRIVALADVYDALTNSRVYKNAMPHEDAVKIIEEGDGSHFDPVIVAAFRQQVDAFAAAAKDFEGREHVPMT